MEPFVDVVRVLAPSDEREKAASPPRHRLGEPVLEEARGSRDEIPHTARSPWSEDPAQAGWPGRSCSTSSMSVRRVEGFARLLRGDRARPPERLLRKACLVAAGIVAPPDSRRENVVSVLTICSITPLISRRVPRRWTIATGDRRRLPPPGLGPHGPHRSALVPR